MKNNFSGYKNNPGHKFQGNNKPPQNVKKGNLFEGLSFFEKAELLFKNLEYDCFFELKSKTNPVDYLVVSLGEHQSDYDLLDEDEIKDEQRRYLKEHTMIQLMFLNDLVVGADGNVLNNEGQSYMLQFFTTFPMKFKLEMLSKINGLLLVLNRTIPIGALGMDQNQKIYFRYTLMTNNKEADLPMVTEIVEMIRFFTNTCRKKITAFAEGEQSLQAITEESEKGTLFQNV